MVNYRANTWWKKPVISLEALKAANELRKLWPRISPESLTEALEQANERAEMVFSEYGLPMPEVTKSYLEGSMG